ncbi:TetR family transcriptional regulator [Mycobacterium sp. E2699]|nr:TetR family transcriptional regulator [Mycobacterium sp. E2699]
MPVDGIIATALQIVDEEGADALSMRALAQRLGSGTATLYRHFANRAELIAHVVDRVFAEIEFDAERLEGLGWQQAIHAAAESMFEALRRHTNAASLLAEQLPVGPYAMAYRERFVALLLDNEFPRELAARSYATLARYVLGFAMQWSGHTTAEGPADPRFSAQFEGLDTHVFPATAAVAEHLPVPLEDEFEFGLQLIIDGLARRLEQDRLRRKTKSRGRD